jgi:hypothetical protein
VAGAEQLAALGRQRPGFLRATPAGELLAREQAGEQVLLLFRCRRRSLVGERHVAAPQASLPIILLGGEALFSQVRDQARVGFHIELEAAVFHPHDRGDDPDLGFICCSLHVEAGQDLFGEDPWLLTLHLQAMRGPWLKGSAVAEIGAFQLSQRRPALSEEEREAVKAQMPKQQYEEWLAHRQGPQQQFTGFRRDDLPGMGNVCIFSLSHVLHRLKDHLERKGEAPDVVPPRAHF